MTQFHLLKASAFNMFSNPQQMKTVFQIVLACEHLVSFHVVHCYFLLNI